MESPTRPGRDAAIYTVAVLSISWAFGAYVFAQPGRMWMFNRVMFVPALVALIMRLVARQGLRQVLAPLTARVDFKTLAFSILYPLGAVAACATVALLTGMAQVSKFDAAKLVPHVTVFAVLVVAGEEYGWRGYLLPTLSAWKGPRAATILVGVIWAVWHAPFLYGLATLLKTADPLVLCAVQMAAVVVVAFPFSYACFRTRSVVPAMLIHYVWNEYNPVVLGNLYRNQPGLLSGNILLINGEGVLGVVLGALAAVWFARNMSFDQRPGPVLATKPPRTGPGHDPG